MFLAVTVAYIPRLGSYGLFDPWETHYAEVARTMLQRDDPISTYWQDDGFYSKPPLLFWMQAAGFWAAGLNTRTVPTTSLPLTSDRMAARLPVVLLAALAVAGVFLFVRLRAGLFPALFASLLQLFCLISPWWPPEHHRHAIFGAHDAGHAFFHARFSARRSRAAAPFFRRHSPGDRRDSNGLPRWRFRFWCSFNISYLPTCAGVVFLGR